MSSRGHSPSPRKVLILAFECVFSKEWVAVSWYPRLF